MKYTWVITLIFLILILGCASRQDQLPQQNPQQVIEKEQQSAQDEPPQEKSDITKTQETALPEEKPKEPEQPNIPSQKLNSESNISSEIKQLFDSSKTKLTSYSYQYRDPSGRQYSIYVKGNKMKIDYISEVKQIYLDTQKKTAEEYCVIYSKCGRQTGKIADLDYSKTYLPTPLDWLQSITEAKKIDEVFYLGKQSWTIDTNIGGVIIDSNYGFIYSIKQKDKSYSFTNTAFNVVLDSDVNIPEYLLPKKSN